MIIFSSDIYLNFSKVDGDALFKDGKSYPVRCRIWRRSSDNKRVLLNSRIQRNYDDKSDNPNRGTGGKTPANPMASGCLAGSTQVQVESKNKRLNNSSRTFIQITC